LYGLAPAEMACSFSSKEKGLLKRLGYLLGIVGIEVEQALDELHASEANLLSA